MYVYVYLGVKFEKINDIIYIYIYSNLSHVKYFVVVVVPYVTLKKKRSKNEYTVRHFKLVVK